MSRHFPNWLKAFEEYSNDTFTPPQFNTWIGLSCIAGAMERKCWLPWSDTFSFFPNIFVMLVSLPGGGKSTSLTRGVGLLQDVVQKGNKINILPSQVTESKFFSLMAEQSIFRYMREGKEIMVSQSAGYYYASEASNELKNVYGDFTAALTAFYDCPNTWERATQIRGETKLSNICLNLLAASTFDYLGKLVTDDNIMGGFASRLIYVVQRNSEVKEQRFQSGLSNTATITKARLEFRQKLVEDLIEIHKLVGAFSATPEFAAAWEKWYPVYEKKRRSMESEKLQSLLVRTNTNILKVSMLLSAAESDDKLLKIHHWEQALALAATNEKELPSIFRQAKSQDTNSQSGLNQAIYRLFEMRPVMTIPDLKARLVNMGFDTRKVDHTVAMLEKLGQFKDIAVSSAGKTVRLLTDTNMNL